MAEKITMSNGVLVVPDEPIIPYVEGDGTGVAIWPAAQLGKDAAAGKHGKTIAWKEVLAGQKAFDNTGSWLPDETVDTFRSHLIGIKGPLTTPVGGGIRSLNVALRQILDLYVCLRPVRWFEGVPSPVKHPEKVDMVIFRQNTEDIYAGIEWAPGTEDAQKVLDFLRTEFPKMFDKVRFGTRQKAIEFWDNADAQERFNDIEVGVGLKPVSRSGSVRLIQSAISYAIANNRKSVTLVHKGNIMKFTEGAFRDWGYDLTRREYKGKAVGWDDCNGKPPAGQVLVKDNIADITLQQVLTRPEDFDVVATMNLNGDYLSDALAAQVGGIGIAPGANINYITGHAIFEATHGTAPKYANQDKVNPGSVILSGVLMLEHMGWQEAADGIIRGLEKTIANKTVTYDFERLMTGAKLLKCSEFGKAIIENM